MSLYYAPKILFADPGIYSPVELIDFGILRTLDEPKTLRLNLINTGPKAIHITVCNFCCQEKFLTISLLFESVFCDRIKFISVEIDTVQKMRTGNMGC